MGKPKKGELAQSTILRQSEKRRDVLRKIKWVNRLRLNPKAIPKDFTKTNLTGLADYSNPKLKLKKISYNTFKSHVEALVPKTEVCLENLSDQLVLLSLKKEKHQKRNYC